MKISFTGILVLLILVGLLAAGCTESGQGSAATRTEAATVSPTQAAAVKTTTADLTKIVNEAVAFAKTNGEEKAIAAFNDPEGQFVRGDVYVFAEAYDGTALAEPFEPEIVGTNIRNLTDRYGVELVKNLEETAGYGIGYVSYEYPNHKNNGTVEHKVSVVADVDGTYYVGAGIYESSGLVYPSTALGAPTRTYSVADLTGFVQRAVAYAQANGEEKAMAAFNNRSGEFVDGEMTIMMLDYNGTVLASSLSPELADNHINLINYHDPDGVATIREMRDIARDGGGFIYTVTRVSAGGKTIDIPKIDYAEPVDGRYWLFSGIIVPGYEQLRTGNLTGIMVRNHTRAEAYDLVGEAAGYAAENGREKALEEINNPAGRFTQGDLFVWAETSDGTILADPYWKESIGKNYLNYTDPYGAKTTAGSLNVVKRGQGFTGAMFPDTATGSSTPIPKLLFLKRIDEDWWIGTGIYGISVR